MSYATEIAKQSKKSFVFARLSIKKRYDLTAAVAHDAPNEIYYIAITEETDDIQSFRCGLKTVNQIGGTSWLTAALFEEVGSIGALSSRGKYFVDTVNSRIYYRSEAVNLGTAVVESSLFYSTTDIRWYTDPTDDQTEMRRWYGSINAEPQIKRGVSDNFSGFAPIEISPLEVQWRNGDLYQYFRERSFVDCLADVWVCKGDIEPDNVSKLFSGKIRGLSFDDSMASFQLVDYSYLLDGVYNGIRVETLGVFDPAESGRGVPLIYGDVKWLKCTNQDYQSDSPSTSNNRTWTVHDTRLGSALQQATAITVGSPSGGSYPVTFSNADSAKLYDGIYMTRNSDGNYARMSGNIGNSWTLTPVGGWTPNNGEAYTILPIMQFRFQVPSSLAAVQDWSPYEANAYLTIADDGSTLSITLNSGFEAGASALGISTIDPNDFEVWVRVMGPGKGDTYNGTYLDKNATQSSPSMPGALAWYLKNVVGLSDSQLNVQSFVDAIAARPFAPARNDNLGSFVTPFTSTDFESHRDVVGAILRDIGGVGYFNLDGEFTIKARDSLATADWVLTESEIKTDSMRYEFYDADLKSIRVVGSSPYIGTHFTFRAIKSPPTFVERTRFTDFLAEPVESGYGRTLTEQRIETSTSYDQCHMLNSIPDGSPLFFNSAQRMATYFGNRIGRMKFTAYGEVVDAMPGDTIEIQRDLLPGYNYIPGTVRSRKFFVLEVERSGDEIELLVEDQYSIEEAGGF